jgi:hypothetical protein
MLGCNSPTQVTGGSLLVCCLHNVYLNPTNLQPLFFGLAIKSQKEKTFLKVPISSVFREFQ